jgi:fluoroacetyl-CoA thioesterase
MKKRWKPNPRAKTIAKHAAATKSPSLSLPRIGLEGAFERIIPHEWTIRAYDPRLPDALSTPAMIGMMEIAAGIAIQAELPSGVISVGTRIEVDHLEAVPSGTLVRATARLAKHKGRFMIFDVEARAGQHMIGRGRVFRAIVEPAKFRAKAQSHSSS